jgi:starch synthase
MTLPVPRMRVLSVASEIYPLIKTGGLADVAGALPAALAAEGIEMRSLLPGYPAVLAKLEAAEAVYDLADLFGGPARLLAGRAAGLELFAIDAPHLFARPGNPYSGPDGADWPDNALRFAALGAAAGVIGQARLPGWVPDVVHAHDWQAGLAPAYLHYLGGAGRPGTVMTIHNLAFQGSFPPELLGRLGLPPQSWSVEGVEFYGGIGFLKAGLYFADRITTVSPSYAAEITTRAGGMGLAGLLRSRAAVLSGILNGIDTAVWDPAADPYLPAPYDARRMKGRVAARTALLARLGLHAGADELVYGLVGRLTWQKGADLLLAALPTLLQDGASLALLGSGDAGVQAGLAAAAAAHPGRVGVAIGYDEALAHLIQAGCDALLVPSRFEPCGLTQLCALRYGAVPVVARTGGLADTVIDANEMAVASGAGTGILFPPDSEEMLETALHRTAALWRDRPAWRRLQRNGMASDVSWARPAARYAALYRGLRPA